MTAPRSDRGSDRRFDREYALEDRYRREAGRVFLTGVQALVRLPLEQVRRDRAAGHDTAGFISGYRGSPLGTYDMALWNARELLESHRVRFEPGVNEDLAATAVWGSQQANLHAGARHDGVFGIWYGKGPGVDRSCDALKHANYAGTAPLGGVLALTGDDPAARSSSIAHQSEQALIHCGIPVLNPSSVQEYLDLGLYGLALSRYAGSWVGFKCLTDTVDSGASVQVGLDRAPVSIPEAHALPEAGLHISWTNIPLQVERRLYRERLPAVQAFVHANGLDRVVLASPRRRIGIVTAGKAYTDVRQGLEELGLDDAAASEAGIEVFKLAMTWPLEPRAALAFARGLDDVIVVEEKRPVIEDQLARLLYNEPQRPRLHGKRDAAGRELVPAVGELSPPLVAELLRGWFSSVDAELGRRLASRSSVPAAQGGPPGLMRLPSFCSGCPHNGSTVVPEGSVALGGIGCHGMAVWLPDRPTLAVTQMGGEGANWIGQAPFTETPHIFQNLGDGTYFHSGLLAIRAAVTAGVNITYKILANGAVAMTGGQPIEGESLAGEVTVPEIVRQLSAEGVGRVVVLSNEPEKYGEPGERLPSSVAIHHRDEIDRVQRELREVPGVTALVYDQTCAAEARRLRKRGEFPDPDRRVLIQEEVCEGCGDCSVQSNCISIEPVETDLGRKRRINQSTCNKDYSCLKGYCPSFAVVTGGRLRKATRDAIELDADLFARLPDPEPADVSRPFNVLVTGIGGSGVVTVGALLGMAAHLEGRGVTTLDVTGLAQKNGPVTSHVRIAESPEDLHATRIAGGSTDLLLGCDIVVASAPESQATLDPGRTTAVVNRDVSPTADFASNPDLDLGSERMEQALGARVGEKDAHFVRATALATALTGDALATNLFLVGYAAQKGRLPVGLATLERALELNGRAVELNRRALAWGRLAAHDLAAVERAAQPTLGGTAASETPAEQSLDARIAARSATLEQYQNRAWGERYTRMLERVRQAEAGLDSNETLTRTVADAYFKLLSYKDEYEVARLWLSGRFQRQLEREFEGDYRVQIQLAPQLFFPHDPDTGRVRKVSVGTWIFPVFRLLARFKFLRGTPLDVFGRSAHRRRERGLIGRYEATLEQLLSGLGAGTHARAVEIAALPEQVRGYDTVKERSIDAFEACTAELLAAYQNETPRSETPRREESRP